MRLNSEPRVVRSAFKAVVGLLSAFSLAAVPAPASASSSLPAPGTVGVYGFFDAVVQSVLDGLRDAVIWLFDSVMDFLQNAPEPEFTGPQAWINGQYDIALEIGLWMLVPFVAAATIQAFFKGGINEVLKLYLLGMPVAVIGGAVALVFAQFLVLITNDICGLFYAEMNSNFQTHMESLRAMDAGAQIDGLFMQGLFFLAMFIGLIVLFIELIIRNVAIYLSVLFIPMALAAWVWEPTRPWLARIIQSVAILIIAKFVIVATLSFSFAIIANLSDGTAEMNGAQGFSVLLLSIAALFMSTVAAPLIIGFVLRPDFDSDVSSFKGLRQESIFNADNYQVNKLYRDTAKNILKRGG